MGKRGAWTEEGWGKESLNGRMGERELGRKCGRLNENN